MLSLFVAIQYIGIIFLVIEICYILKQRSSGLQTLLLIVVIATLINFTGYLFELQADTKELALQAVQFLYLGKPFIILGTFLFCLEYYNIKLPKLLYYVLGCFHTVISLLVLTCRYHRLFYSSIDFVDRGLFPHLVFGHGIMYLVNTVVIAAYLIILLVIGIRRYRKSNYENEKKQISCLIAIALISAAGLLIFMSGTTGGYDSTLPAYLLSTLLLLICMLRYSLLDTVALAKERVIDEFADGLLVLDYNQRVIYVNDQVKRIYPDAGKDEWKTALAELEQLIRTKQRLSVGEKVYELYEKEIKKNSFVYGKMLVVSDITDNYHYTVQLEQQRKIAEEANQAKSDFLAKMSHEIRTPIHAVLGMNEMIIREAKEPEIKKYAMDIKASASTLLGLINDILDTSKIESKKMEIMSVAYELDSLFNDIMNMIGFKVRDKGLEFHLQIQEDIPNRLRGDDVRLRQILVNLLNNAVKYTEQGAVELAVSGVQSESHITLHFEVRDTGIGIKEEDLPKLCQAFERIDEERNRNVEGTGLGMNIVAELLRLMHSRLEVSSIYGQGTTFSFDLQQEICTGEPIGDFAARNHNLYQEEAYKATFVAPFAKLLVVDDNEINRRVFSNLLKETKVQITEADSGFACLKCICREHYDLIFMDYMMPEMNGVETLEKMKALPDNLCRDVPVIILTANAVTGAKEEYLAAGFTDYLSKPIQPQKLEDMVRQYLKNIEYPEDREEGWNEQAEEMEEIEEIEKMEEIEEIEEMEETWLQLPEISELEYEYARMFLQEDELLLATLLDVYDSLPFTMEELEGYAGVIGGAVSTPEEKQQALEQYRICVHALKSNTAVVGALLLSKLARLLEIGAVEGNADRVLTLHPILMEQIEQHRSRMEILEDYRE